ncbi:MAG: DUF5106 domain-containing protein [Bacteroidetes bacterium]|nr:DUF5106 domain-containing protein [Bacteroidota bacterium]
MKRIPLLLSSLALFSFGAKAQGYDITVNFKNAKDTMAYLVKYTWDQQYISDTAKNIKNGVMRFKGKTDLDKGVYVLVNQDKAIYFDFFINESQKFTIEVNHNDIVNTMKAVNSKENELFFSYVKFMSNKNIEFNKTREKAAGKPDSAKIVTDAIKTLNEEVKKFEADYMIKSKGTFVYDVMNLKSEKEPTDVPKASNGRPDSVYSYYWYKNHYFDGVNFKDERIIRTPFFDDRVKKYFESVILNHPDTVIVEIDKILAKCEQDNLVYNLLLGYFTHKYEQSKIMGFDKVFVHLADKYIISGKASKVYEKETVTKIKERVDIMRNLLLGAQVSDLYVIDTTDAKTVRKWGFDTASSSKAITDLYYKHEKDLQPLWKTLHSVQAKYTILVFWAVDCGHCKTEVPKLASDLKAIKGKVDYKVFAVQTKDELYSQWCKFIIDNNLNDIIHVYDPIHINNLKEKFDIYSTPVIYLLDQDKKIRAKRVGAEQVVDILKSFEGIKDEPVKEETPAKKEEKKDDKKDSKKKK